MKYISTMIVMLVISLFVATIGIASSTALAQTTQPAPAPAADDSCKKGGILNFPRWYDGICQDGQIASPGTGEGALSSFIWKIALNVLDMMLYLVGYISLGFIIWGGFKFMISGDNASGVASARKTILNAVIGLVISIMSVAIVNVITGAVG